MGILNHSIQSIPSRCTWGRWVGIKPCSMVKIQCIFRVLILRASPQVRARFQDIRKYASFLAFFSGMSTMELCNRIGWY